MIGCTKETFSSGGGEWLIYGTQGRSYVILHQIHPNTVVMFPMEVIMEYVASPTAINDDLILYIGLKNTVAL